MPLAGDAYDILSAVAGKDLLTGESIGGVGIAATFIGTIAGSGKLAREGAELAGRYSEGKAALVEMAKADKRKGVTLGDMKAYQELNQSLPDPFPSSKVRVDPGHLSRSPHSRKPHGHVGPVDHIPIVERKP